MYICVCKKKKKKRRPQCASLPSVAFEIYYQSQSILHLDCFLVCGQLCSTIFLSFPIVSVYLLNWLENCCIQLPLRG